MKEHDELIKKLSTWSAYGSKSCNADYELDEAYRAYRNAPPPLVLEPVEYQDLDLHEPYIKILYKVQMPNRENIGECYRIPETE